MKRRWKIAKLASQTMRVDVNGKEAALVVVDWHKREACALKIDERHRAEVTEAVREYYPTMPLRTEE